MAANRAGKTSDALLALDRALAEGPAVRERARIQLLRGQIEVWLDAPMRAHELLLTEAALVEGADPRLAVEMLVTAARAAITAGEVAAAGTTSRRAHAIVRRSGAGVPGSLRAFDLIVSQGSAKHERAIRRELAELDGSGAPDALDQAFESGVVLLWLEDYAGARRVLAHVVERAREGRRGPVLPVALDTLAALDFRTGHWAAADARSAEALRLSRELGQTLQTASCLTTLAKVAAARGREYECRGYLAAARELVPAGHLVGAYAAVAAGLLELGLGRPEAAIEELRPLQRRETDQLPRAPMVVPWAPDLIEAFVRAGDREQAAQALRAFEERVLGSRRAWAVATVARCRGLLADDGFRSEFAVARRQHARTPTPFELARTELCFGERLRRSRRQVEAMSVLKGALVAFEELGAVPWADRARRELARRRRPAGARKSDTADVLTAHELKVAALVARGATNREAASACFVSPKTIEYHLTSIYRKLDVRSRTELALRLAAGGDGARHPGAGTAAT